jgi:hypothetical protein
MEDFKKITTEDQEQDFNLVEKNDEDNQLQIDENDKKEVVSQTQDIALRDFLSRKIDGELNIQPDYQRNYVATDQIASKYVESILMQAPIPTIYLAEEEDNTLSVIDGQQRLTSLLSFIEGKYPDGREFKLKGLEVLKELNRKSFKDLDKSLQRKIKNASLHTTIIKKNSNNDIKFDMFERLNTGSIKLNEDELRNTVYRGSYVKLLSELENNSVLHGIVKKDNWKNRMLYRGMILRFFAISEKSYMNYQQPMKQFCNKELRDNRNMDDSKSKEYKEKFLHCLDLVNTVFGDKAFRKYVPQNGDKKGFWAMGQVSMALFDMQMVGFRNFTKSQILSKADEIRDGILDLMINNVEFQNLILIRTSNTDNVKRRFRIYMDMLESIVSKPTTRIFPFSLKKELFDKKPVCALSGQTILNIEDAEVDHIIPYSKGGETTRENAQLVLRYFNRAKNNNMEYAV